jgi:hypothetical protein
VLKEDPYLSTKKIAMGLNVSSLMVQNRLTKSLGMKSDNMRWVSHTLTAVQKAKWKNMVGSMLQVLQSHAASTFRFLSTGMSRGCAISTTMKQCGHHRGTACIGFGGRRMITGRLWLLYVLTVQGSTS